MIALTVVVILCTCSLSASAFATELPTCGNIAGEGDIPQNIWISAFTATPGPWEKGCANDPMIAFTPFGSGIGLKAWGAEKAGNEPNDGKEENPAESGYTFIDSEEPPDKTQIENIDEAAGAGGEDQALVTPVAQAAVAMLLNPPSECTMNKITNKQLQEMWNDEITQWSSIATGSGCTDKEITRVVSKDVSDATHAFKAHLGEISKGATCSGKTWAYYTEPAHSKEWPECGHPVVRPTGTNDSEEVTKVATTEGAIGLALCPGGHGRLCHELERVRRRERDGSRGLQPPSLVVLVVGFFADEHERHVLQAEGAVGG